MDVDNPKDAPLIVDDLELTPDKLDFVRPVLCYIWLFLAITHHECLSSRFMIRQLALMEIRVPSRSL